MHCGKATVSFLFQFDLNTLNMYIWPLKMYKTSKKNWLGCSHTPDIKGNKQKGHPYIKGPPVQPAMSRGTSIAQYALDIYGPQVQSATSRHPGEPVCPIMP